MRARHISAHALFFFPFLAGCFLSHEVGGAPLHDAGVHSIFVEDAGVHTTPAHDAGAPAVDAATCELVTTRIEVHVEQLGRVSCDRPHLDDVRLARVDPEAALDGVRLHFDFCPAADEDCRCDLVVSNVGAELADADFAGVEGSLDWDPSFVSLQTVSKVFYAADAPPEAAPAVPPNMYFSTGAITCRATTRCGGIDVHYLDVGVDDVGIPLTDRATTVLDGVEIRCVRAPYTTCDCPECRPRGSAAWVAWTAPRRGA